MPNPIALEQIRRRDHTAIELPEPLPLDALPTPALVLERAPFERNIAKMATHVATHGKGFRPHAKTHKCPLIASAQLDAGAVGVCVAKVSEAVALASAGIHEVLITSPVATAPKADVVAQLASSNEGLMIVVDSDVGLEALRSALPGDARLGVLIDLDVNLGRTGTRDDDAMLRLAAAVAEDPRLRFGGVQFYAGHMMHVPTYEKRRDKSLALWGTVLERLQKFDERGIEVPVVTGCGTGTYNIDVEVDRITDLQVGSYIFMDEEYRLIGGPDSDRFEDFEVSLTVACTTISQPSGKGITVDGGFKAFASDTVEPVSDELANVNFKFYGDEHGVLFTEAGEQSLALGQVHRFVTPHCDPTVNLHELYWVLEEDGLVHSCWPITARGCVW